MCQVRLFAIVNAHSSCILTALQLPASLNHSSRVIFSTVRRVIIQKPTTVVNKTQYSFPISPSQSSQTEAVQKNIPLLPRAIASSFITRSLIDTKRNIKDEIIMNALSPIKDHKKGVKSFVNTVTASFFPLFPPPDNCSAENSCSCIKLR